MECEYTEITSICVRKLTGDSGCHSEPKMFSMLQSGFFVQNDIVKLPVSDIFNAIFDDL